MATPLTLEVFQLNEYLWKLQRWPKLFFEWDSSVKKFRLKSNSIRLMPYWLFSFLPLVILLSMNIFLLLVELRKPTLNNVLYVFSTLEIFLLNTYCVVNILYVFSKRLALVAYLNSLIASCINNHGTVSVKQNPSIIMFLKSIAKEAWKLKTEGKCDVVGILINLIGLFLGVLPPLWTLGGIIMCLTINVNIDPPYLLLRYFIHDENSYWGLRGLVRIILCYLCIMEGARTFCHMFLSIIIACQCTLSSLKKIEQIAKENMIQGVKAYNAFVILHLKGKMEILSVPLFALVAGYTALSLSASATVMGFKLLPSQVYWIAPLLSSIGVIVLMVALPFATACYTVSENLLRKWIVTKEAIGIKRFRKRLKAMRPIRFYFGEFRELNKEFMTVYLMSFIERTMSITLFFNSLFNPCHL